MATKQKVLLMGRSNSGKTSMRSIIFANFMPKDTKNLVVTIDYEYASVKFLDDLSLNLWDCGGQDQFMENYLLHQQNIFSNVESLIYVFDVESRESDKDFAYYRKVIEALKTYSKQSSVFCLVHKMDLLTPRDGNRLFQQKETEIKQISFPFKPTCFRTSIWDETLYKAWSAIITSMIPRREVLEQQLVNFADICDANEVVLFERSTFLVLAHAGIRKYNDVHRFEKISNIVKQFKLSCSKFNGHFTNMEIQNRYFRCIFAQLTPHSFVLIVSDPSIQSEATLLNINSAKDHFTKLFQQLRSY